MLPMLPCQLLLMLMLLQMWLQMLLLMLLLLLLLLPASLNMRFSGLRVLQSHCDCCLFWICFAFTVYCQDGRRGWAYDRAACVWLSADTLTALGLKCEICDLGAVHEEDAAMLLRRGYQGQGCNSPGITWQAHTWPS